jgi:hypothetical protein
MKAQSMLEVSANTSLLTERLSKLQPDEMVPYVELNKTIGRNVQKEARHHLTSAMHRVLMLHQIYICSVRNVGVKRVTPEQNAGLTPEQARLKLNRAARRSRRALDCISDAEYKLLPNDLKIKLGAGRALTGMIMTASNFHKKKLLENSVKDGEKKLQMMLSYTLAAFKD